MSTDQTPERHRTLLDQGWTRRFTVDEPRLTEMRQLYESMGLEVRIETPIPDEGQPCQGCFNVEGFADLYKTIYTRVRDTSDSLIPDDMFD